MLAGQKYFWIAIKLHENCVKLRIDIVEDTW